MKVEKIIAGVIIFFIIFLALLWAVNIIWVSSFGLFIEELDLTIVFGILFIIFITSGLATWVILEKLGVIS